MYDIGLPEFEILKREINKDNEIYFEMYKRGIKCFIIPQKRSGTDVARYENRVYNFLGGFCNFLGGC